jgi:GDPmannose 4,6-dehydratase
MKKAVIVGCNGQDGRLLEENLSRRDYRITGIDRPSSQPPGDGRHLTLDILDFHAVSDLIRTVAPDEIYYLAAFHHAAENLHIEETGDLFQKSFQVHVLAPLNFLEAMKKYAPAARFFYAASSHVFGKAVSEPQNEETPFHPIDIYGITKEAGVETCRFYRNQLGLFISTAILFNHESPYRKPVFVTKKIIDGAIEIKNGHREKLLLGNLDAEVDWGYAPDYVEAFRRILSTAMPNDFIVATGIKHTVREFVEITFGYLGLDWTRYVEEDRHLIAKDGTTLVGDPRKLMQETGWKPSVDFKGMIRLLLENSGVSVQEK